MSRLWADRLYVAVDRSRVGLVILRGPWGNTIKDSSLVEASDRASALEAGLAAISSLSEQLSQFDVAGACLHLTLSDAFARYVTVPALEQVRTERERASFATARFAETYGDASQSWTIRCDAAGANEAVLACAIESELLEAIHALVAVHRLRLASITTALVRFLNQRRTRLPAGRGLVMAAAGSAVVAAAYENEGWTYVASQPGRMPSESGEIRSLIRRELLLAGYPDDVSCVIVGDPIDPTVGNIESLTVLSSDGESSALGLSQYDPILGLALSARA